MPGAAHAFLKALPVFATLPARKVESLSAGAREEAYRPLDLRNVEALRERARGEADAP